MSAEAVPDDERDQAGRARARRQQIGIHAQDAVQAEIQRRAGEHRGECARRGGIGALQPGVHRHEAGFHAEAEEREEKHPPAGVRVSGRYAADLSASNSSELALTASSKNPSAAASVPASPIASSR